MFHTLALHQSIRVKVHQNVNIFNSVDNTELPFYMLPLTQNHSFFRNLPPVFMSFIPYLAKTVPCPLLTLTAK